TRRAAAALLQKVARAVLITLGEKGAYYLSKSGEEAFVPAIPVQATDTTAAGDVFNGYLAAALAEGSSYAAAIAWAGRAAAISVTRKGAQPSIPQREEVL
ncbi:MAG: ribokinase, partial [Bacteroidetes bacterium]